MSRISSQLSALSYQLSAISYQRVAYQLSACRVSAISQRPCLAFGHAVRTRMADG
ncbi:MAG: hypothetical protein F6K37_29005 [Moorea sp. SIO4E2]|nr:hypothetical protein [Moorena sp. SIO4E2]